MAGAPYLAFTPMLSLLLRSLSPGACPFDGASGLDTGARLYFGSQGKGTNELEPALCTMSSSEQPIVA